MFKFRKRLEAQAYLVMLDGTKKDIGPVKLRKRFFKDIYVLEEEINVAFTTSAIVVKLEVQVNGETYSIPLEARCITT